MSAAILQKVRFPLDSTDWHGAGGETLWAAPTGDGPRLFRIMNSPFFARGISHLDVVEVTHSEDKVTLEFARVVERSGHSTYMLIATADETSFQSYWSRLEATGCTYESTHINLNMGRRLLLSVDVPPSANLNEAYQILESGETDGAWVFQEGYTHLPQ